MLTATLSEIIKTDKIYDYLPDYNSHDTDTIIDVLDILCTDHSIDEINDIEDVQESLYEICDSQTPIYNTDLIKWLAGNTSTFEDQIEELGTQIGGKNGTSLMQAIMMAYCSSLERDTYTTLSNILDEYTN